MGIFTNKFQNLSQHSWSSVICHHFSAWKYFRYDQSLVKLFNAVDLIKISRSQPWNMTIDFPKPNWLMTINNRLDFFRQHRHTHLRRGGRSNMSQSLVDIYSTKTLTCHAHGMYFCGRYFFESDKKFYKRLLMNIVYKLYILTFIPGIWWCVMLKEFSLSHVKHVSSYSEHSIKITELLKKEHNFLLALDTLEHNFDTYKQEYLFSSTIANWWVLTDIFWGVGFCCQVQLWKHICRMSLHAM